MDAAAIFDARKADVAAFSSLLFRPSAAPPVHAVAHSEDTATAKKDQKTRRAVLKRGTQESTTTTAAADDAARTSSSSSTTLPLPFPTAPIVTAASPSYRRPASANVPVSRVVSEAKARAARQRRREGQGTTTIKARSASSPSAGFTSTAAASTTGSVDTAVAGNAHAMGFTAQELCDRTYLWMSHRLEGAEKGKEDVRDTADGVNHAASRLSGVLTPQQHAQLRRLRVKRTHQHALPYAQWVLLLRRRRRLWQRRRPVARRRHLRRRLALQHGCALQPCSCCSASSSTKQTARKAGATRVKVSAAHTSQWLPSHARLVKRFHHRVVVLALPRSVTHAAAPHRSSRGRKGQGGGTEGGASPVAAAAATAGTSVSQRKRHRAVLTARVSIPVGPTRKRHRQLQRWASELGVQQRRVDASGLPASTTKSTSAQPSPLDTSLLAEVSHQCVYTITPYDASATLTVLDVARAVGLRGISTTSTTAPTGLVLSRVFTSTPRRTRQSRAVVLHGHMWGATEDHRATASTRSGTSADGSRVSTLARHTRVVPVVLIAAAADAVSKNNNSSGGVSLVLFSEAPVLIPRRARTVVQAQLISAWNPCCRSPALASVYEYWQWAPWSTQTSGTASVRTACPLPPAVEAVRGALRRTMRVQRRLRRRAALERTRRHLSRMRKMRKSKKREKKPTAVEKSKLAKQRAMVTSPLKDRAAAAAAATSSRASPSLSLVVFPSLPAPFLHSPANHGGRVGSTYAWRVAVIYHRPQSRPRTRVKTTASPRVEGNSKGLSPTATAPSRALSSVSPRQAYRSSVRARRAHYHLARRLFGFLLATPQAAREGTAATAARTRVLGVDDRATLLRLVGRPSYPADYGQSRPAVASQQRMRRRHAHHTPRRALVTRPGVKRIRDTAAAAATGVADEGEEEQRAVTPRPVTALPSYVHTLEYCGNVTTAACRLTVRSAHADKRLPTLHSAVGSVLLRWWPQRRSGSSDGGDDKDGEGVMTVVERVGVVSSSPFFAQRFGSVVAPVWCCFPPPPSLPSASTRGVGSGRCCCCSWTAETLLSPSSKCSTSLFFVLAPPEAAATLLRRSASLAREPPVRQRTSSRHQRAFDLVRGRGVREMASLLCDPTFCTPVLPIRWYE